MTQRHDMHTASEYLRLTLPYLSRYRVPATPRNYAVWYEYVAGEHPELSAAIERLIESKAAIDSDVTRELYARFVAGWTEQQVEQARAALFGLIDRIEGIVSSAGGDVGRYEASLDAAADRLAEEISASELRGVVSELLEATTTVRDSAHRLNARLDESREETKMLRAELERARTEAVTDPLTGLSNRRGFDIAIEALVSADASDDAECCLVMADIDRFKQINDKYGHLLGDKVLRFVASTLRACVGEREMVARFGGEEFVALLPDTSLDAAVALAERMRSRVEAGRLVRSDTREPIDAVTMSIGVAMHRPGESAASLVERADEALRRAKAGGRNRVEAAEETRAVA